MTCFWRNYVPPVGNHEFAANRKRMSARLATCTSLLQPTPHDSGDHVRPSTHPHSRFPLRLTGVYIHLPSRAAPVPDQNQRDIAWIPSWIANCRWRCRQTAYSPLYCRRLPHWHWIDGRILSLCRLIAKVQNCARRAAYRKAPHMVLPVIKNSISRERATPSSRERWFVS